MVHLYNQIRQSMEFGVEISLLNLGVKATRIQSYF